jgi:hypothetical protein
MRGARPPAGWRAAARRRPRFMPFLIAGPASGYPTVHPTYRADSADVSDRARSAACMRVRPFPAA